MPKVSDEARIEQYQLKATFFSNQIEKQSFLYLFGNVLKFIKSAGDVYDWSKLSDLEVDSDVLKSIKGAGKHVPLYFCHPAVLLGYPHSLRYYRCISVFPHKGLKAVSGVSSTEKIEDGASPTKEQAFKLARAINRNLSLIYKNGVSSEEKLRAIMYATAGSSLEGGWRNQIGKEGERVIKTLLLQHLRAKGELTTLAYVGGRVLKKSQITESVIEVDGGEFASAVMVNGSSLKFASEPDITILDNKGEIKAGVEIKAGLDPAGALERLGAMLKSFDALLYSESTAETVLIVSCLTDEVQRRILAAKSVTRTMMLTDITSDKKGEQQRFYTIMRAYLGLAKSTR